MQMWKSKEASSIKNQSNYCYLLEKRYHFITLSYSAQEAQIKTNRTERLTK